MSARPIVVAVDSSPEAAWAAALGADLARAGGTSCQLAHATREVVSAPALAELPEHAEEFTAAQIAQARERLLHGLWGVVPTALLEQVVIRVGRPALLAAIEPGSGPHQRSGSSCVQISRSCQASIGTVRFSLPPRAS